MRCARYSFGAGGKINQKKKNNQKHPFHPQADIILRGYSGYNTDNALAIAPAVLPVSAAPTDLAAVVVFFGANDAALPDRRSARQHVPLPRYRANVASLVRAARGAGAARVVVATPPPVCEAGRRRHAASFGEDGPPERTLAAACAYAAAAKEAAADAGADAVVDLCTELQACDEWPKFLSDGLHLTPEGNAAVFDRVSAALAGAGLDPETMKLDFKPWDEYEPVSG